MSKEKMRDPFAEYDAAIQAEKLILRKMSEYSEMGMDKPDVIEAVNKLSMGLVRIQKIRDEAKKQYNAQVAQTRHHIDKALELTSAIPKTELEAINNINNALFHIVHTLNNVFQTEPLGDEDGPKIERKED